jgi:hypothetical protein
VTNSDAELPPPPHRAPRAEDQIKLRYAIAGLFVALLGFIALLGFLIVFFTMGGSYPNVKAQDAAVVGDVVTVRDAASTVLCEDRNDALKIHMAGEITMRQSELFDKDAGKAVMKKDAARKIVIGEAHSCQWAPRGVRYTVKKKEIVGTDNDDFHVVAYCLQPNGRDTCFWVAETFDRNAPIEKTADRS